ncbi:MAG: AAA family ATPase [Actinomycetota bacterium]
MTDNPFRPSFGRTPPVLAGRDGLIARFDDTFGDGAWAPERISLIRGLRGIGKTVLLNAIEDAARRAHWFVISETARLDLVHSLTHTVLPRLLRDHDPQGRTRHIVGAGLSGASLSTQVADEHQPDQDLRDQLTRLCTLASDQGLGVLITLDEIYGDVVDQVRPLTIALQHLQREELDVAFVGAGLPVGLDEVLQDKGTTFLRRATLIDLDSLTLEETLRALREPIATAGRTIADDALEQAALASRGYPFLVQAIGSFAWEASPEDTAITLAAVRSAARRAHRTMGSNIHAPSLSRLSPTDRTFLAAMAHDEGPSRLGEVANRMGVDTKYASVYRQRLITAGLIDGAEWGKVEFALPYLRDYLREHVVASTLKRSAKSTFPSAEPDLRGSD